MARLIFPKDTADAKRLSKRVVKGELKRIRQGMYTDADWADIPDLIRRKWHEIVVHLYPGAILSHATAALLGPQNQAIHITAAVNTQYKVAISDALLIHVHPGNITECIQPFLPELWRSDSARYLLENLQIAHSDANVPKALGREWVEKELCKLLERVGEVELQRIRDDARQCSHVIGLNSEFKQLDAMVGALLATRPTDTLVTPVAIALAKRAPFDQHRIVLFEALVTYLRQCELPVKPYDYSKASWRHLAFYESYFSNYIEGTEFDIDEAEQIIFEQQEVLHRHQDSHDILSVYDVVNDYTEMTTVPDSAESLMQLLCSRHALIMHARPDKRPGEFKQKVNKAGSTVFVLPENVEATLANAFPLYQQLPPGFERAVFMQFLISECHPFDDGNGRLARIMMNAELVAAEQHKVIVPTVHRDSYLNGLRHASRRGHFRTVVKVFADLHVYTSLLPWGDYGEARKMLESHYADRLPDDGVAVFNKQLSQFRHILPVG